jgi:ABC-2 type transport system ATP-binding protein
MKILTGFHFPSDGTAKLGGFSVTDDPVEVKKRTGYLPERVPLYNDMTVDEYLSFMAAARLISPDRQKEAREKSIADCGLKEVRSQLVETLSKGYKQRVGLAQAIIHDPPILILDEPTSGLDPNQIIEIRSLIKQLGKSKTVILSTHILQEVEAICSQVLILNEGRIAAQGTPEEIAGTLKGGDTWELILKGTDIAQKYSRLYSQYLNMSIDTSPEIVEENGFYNIRIIIPAGESEGSIGKNAGELIFDWAVAEGLKITGMNRHRLSLEDIFVKLTGDEKTSAKDTQKTEAPDGNP